MEFINSRLRYIKPRFKVFKDWYKTINPLNRILPNGQRLHLRNGMKFYVRELRGSDVSILIDMFLNDEYNLKDYNLKKGDVILDIGANIGTFVQKVRQDFKDVDIYAYEPDTRNFDLLVKNTNNEPHLFNAAVTSKEGYSTMYINDSYSGSTLVRSVVNPKISNPKTVQVKNITLKSILSSFDKVALMKMDIEGSEYDVIYNTDKSLFNKVQNISIEIHNHREKIDEMVEYIKSLGFRLVNKKVELYTFSR